MPVTPLQHVRYRQLVKINDAEAPDSTTGQKEDQEVVTDSNDKKGN